MSAHFQASLGDTLTDELARIQAMSVDELRAYWRQAESCEPPPAFSRDLLARAACYRLQEHRLGRLNHRLKKLLKAHENGPTNPARTLKAGSIIVREHLGEMHEVMIVPDGYCWRGKTYSSLSTIAKKITGTTWSGPRFFGLNGKGRKDEGSDQDLDELSHREISL
ncbi:DUF2924 domain-containing protein [Methylocella sp. CPCC 101449]|uniref:DUF2924 domain-containing protein n=1 Tax=Methylocella sp. CPCC 101449 TaxID=2987531 RepID=UPI00288C6583|nr:DUF2924 domain-containing protein [Methylocella sp. CPCC 101449]MDT2021199.1 DUF2924 domain-containing protein [Methylocella sp. CPCC 101449]